MKYEIFSSKYFGIEPEPVNRKFEKLDMKMQEGYGYEMSGDADKAVACWGLVFDEIKACFEENHFSELKAFDDIFKGTQYVRNWVQDYDDALRQVLLDYDQVSTQEIGRQKIDLLNFVLSLNLLEEMTVHNHKRYLAETYYLMGQEEVGEKHFIQLIEDYPDNEWGYIGYSDQYWMNDSKHKDYDKAMRILDKAYNRMTIKEGDVLVERITGLMIDMKTKELENFLEMEKEAEVPEERPLVPNYQALYQKLFDVREEKLGRTKEKVAINYGFNQSPLIKGKKIGRNEPCPCGSGKKYKKCCGK